MDAELTGKLCFLWLTSYLSSFGKKIWKGLYYSILQKTPWAGHTQSKHATLPQIVYHVVTAARKSLTIKAPHHADRVAHRPTPRRRNERSQMFGSVRVCKCFFKSAPSRTITANHYTRPKNFFPFRFAPLSAQAPHPQRDTVRAHRAPACGANLGSLSLAG